MAAVSNACRVEMGSSVAKGGNVHTTNNNNNNSWGGDDNQMMGDDSAPQLCDDHNNVGKGEMRTAATVITATGPPTIGMSNFLQGGKGDQQGQGQQGEVAGMMTMTGTGTGKWQ